MTGQVVFDSEFEALPAEVQDELYVQAAWIERFGPEAGRPRVDTVKGSRFSNMKELRFDAADGVWRVAFAFDPKRRAILLVAGDKPGGSEKRFYKKLIGKAKEEVMKTLKEKLKALPSGRREAIKRRAEGLIAEEMTIRELRKARRMTQVEMAKALGVGQDQVSRIEKRTDLHISTLRRSIEAMGGELTLVAKFPDGAPIQVRGFAEIDV